MRIISGALKVKGWYLKKIFYKTTKRLCERNGHFKSSNDRCKIEKLQDFRFIFRIFFRVFLECFFSDF